MNKTLTYILNTIYFVSVGFGLIFLIVIVSLLMANYFFYSKAFLVLGIMFFILFGLTFKFKNKRERINPIFFAFSATSIYYIFYPMFLSLEDNQLMIAEIGLTAIFTFISFVGYFSFIENEKISSKKLKPYILWYIPAGKFPFIYLHKNPDRYSY